MLATRCEPSMTATKQADEHDERRHKCGTGKPSHANRPMSCQRLKFRTPVAFANMAMIKQGFFYLLLGLVIL